MNDPKLISLLRCPIDGSELAFAQSGTIRLLNEAIQRGELRDLGDQKLTLALQAGLVAVGGTRLYPIRNNIPSLIATDAINLSFIDLSTLPEKPNR
jgi:uncharacterized protein YbaR (Trm112 family)